MNYVHLIGNISSDVEYFKSEDFTKSKFRIAVDRRSGETDFFNVVCFNKLADIVNEYMGKGRKIYVGGSIQTRQFEGDKGKMFFTDILANNIEFLDGKGDEL